MSGNEPTSLVLTKERLLINRERERQYLLGKWCINYADSIKNIRALEQIVLPYPFDEEGLLAKSYDYLQFIDKRLFPQLVEQMNKAHHVNHSFRYWRIVIGYWWREFIEVVYERYLCLKRAAEAHPDAQVKVLDESHFITPYDSKDFEVLYKEDFYNHQLYTEIISYLHLFSSQTLTGAELQTLDFLISPLQEGWRNRVKQLMCLLSRWNSRYIASSYLTNDCLIKLALKFKIFPTLDTHRIFVSNDRSIDYTKRIALKLQGGDEFEKLIAALLPRHLPKIYFEDFEGLSLEVSRWFPRKKMKFVLTANAFACNEGFKSFAAQQTEKNKTPFIILQHGGHYGCGAWNSSEDYEKEIADYYLTYGWKEDNKKVIPFIVNRFQGSENDNVKGQQDGDLIWVLSSFPRYAYTMYSVPVGPQFVDYLNEQAAFFKALPAVIREKVKARMYQHAYGWHDLEYLQHQTELKINKDDQSRSLIQAAQDSRLTLITYNATAHLETLSLNAPTIMYWNPNHWLLRPSAQPLHDLLREVGILYDDPLKAAAQVSLVFDSVEEWWQQSSIQQARREFCQYFARTERKEGYVAAWDKMLLTLGSASY